MANRIKLLLQMRGNVKDSVLLEAALAVPAEDETRVGEAIGGQFESNHLYNVLKPYLKAGQSVAEESHEHAEFPAELTDRLLQIVEEEDLPRLTKHLRAMVEAEGGAGEAEEFVELFEAFADDHDNLEGAHLVNAFIEENKIEEEQDEDDEQVDQPPEHWALGPDRWSALTENVDDEEHLSALAAIIIGAGKDQVVVFRQIMIQLEREKPVEEIIAQFQPRPAQTEHTREHEKEQKPRPESDREPVYVQQKPEHGERESLLGGFQRPAWWPGGKKQNPAPTRMSMPVSRPMQGSQIRRPASKSALDPATNNWITIGVIVLVAIFMYFFGDRMFAQRTLTPAAAPGISLTITILSVAFMGAIIGSFLESDSKADPGWLDWFAFLLAVASLVAQAKFGWTWWVIAWVSIAHVLLIIACIWNPSSQQDPDWLDRWFDATALYHWAFALILLNLAHWVMLPYPTFLPVGVPIVVWVLGAGRELFRHPRFSFVVVFAAILCAIWYGMSTFAFGMMGVMVLANKYAEDGVIPSKRTSSSGLNIGGWQPVKIIAWDILLIFMQVYFLIVYFLYNNPVLLQIGGR